MQKVPHLALGAYVTGQLFANSLKLLLYVACMPRSSPLWIRVLCCTFTFLGHVNFFLFWRWGVSYASTCLCKTVFALYLSTLTVGVGMLFSGVTLY